MMVITRLASIVLFAAFSSSLIAQTTGQRVYMRSDVSAPWGQITNENAMDAAFGADNWTTAYYETADTSTLLTSSTAFIFMEGGDSSFAGFAQFIQDHTDDLTAWVTNGGRLLIISAPNDPLNDVSQSLPGGVTLRADAFYGSAASSAYATDISNPIFAGPNTTALNFSGDFFSHGYFEGEDMQVIMMSNINQIILAQKIVGTGLIVYGGMTTDNFQLPQPAAHQLLENMITYTATSTLDN